MGTKLQAPNLQPSNSKRGPKQASRSISTNRTDFNSVDDFIPWNLELLWAPFSLKTAKTSDQYGTKCWFSRTPAEKTPRRLQNLNPKFARWCSSLTFLLREEILHDRRSRR